MMSGAAIADLSAKAARKAAAVATQAPAMLALLHLVMDDDATHETYVEEWAAILRAISPGE